MKEFDVSQFCALLRAVPEARPIVEPPERSEYLQKQVFDVLKEKGRIDLRQLDWDAFDIKHVIFGQDAASLNSIPDGWLSGINRFLHNTPGAATDQRRFF